MQHHQDVPRGHVTREFTMWCGCCGNWQQEQRDTRAQFVASMKRAGWRLTKSLGYTCPTCVKHL